MSLVTNMTAAFQQVASTFKYLLYLPVKPANADYMLRLTGGVASWLQVKEPTVLRFTANGTYTPTTGMRYIIAEIQGAGGGAGGTVATILANQTAFSGGSASGAYAKIMLTAAQVGASRAITVGAAGTAGTAGAAGGAGGASTITGVASAPGGNGSAVSAASNTLKSAAGGTAAAAPTITLGTLIHSVSGQTGQSSAGTSNTAVSSVGRGGGSPLGEGGQGVNANASFAGNAGNGFGSGASGRLTHGAATAAQVGLAGQPGIVIITEYF